MKRNTLTALSLAAALLSAPAFAAPKMSVDMKAEKDVVVVEKGKQVKKRVDATSQAAGEVVIYTIRYSNAGDESASNVQLDNRIPAETSYVGGSAKGMVPAVFSADGGKTYGAPEQLTREAVDANGKKKTVAVEPEKYTDIRWVLPQVKAGESGQVSYEVRVK